MISVTLNHPFREGGSNSLSASLATGQFDVGVAGRGWFLDLASNLFDDRSSEMIRPQSDDSANGTEKSLSNTQTFRRSMRSWHQGAGQRRGDEDESLPYRYQDSFGVNPWDKWRLALLPQAPLVDTPASSGVDGIAVVGDLCAYQSGVGVRQSTDGEVWSSLGTWPLQPSTPPVSTGEEIYAGFVDGEVRKMTTGGVVSVEWTLPAQPDALTLAKGRVWAGSGNELYWMTPGVPAELEFTHPWSGWRWSAIVEGSRAVYAAGYLGDKSQIYRVALLDDGTDFSAATVAATLPDGELVTAVGSYLGLILLGTTKGVRLAVPDQSGDLSYGPLIPTNAAVTAFEGQDRFVWYSVNSHVHPVNTSWASGESGLGRMDLSTFTSDLVPAYANDLFPESGLGLSPVSSIVTFSGRRLFSITNEGVYAEDPSSVVQSGYLVTPSWSFGVMDRKVAATISITHLSLPGYINVDISTDGSSFGTVEVHTDSAGTGHTNDNAVKIEPLAGNEFAVRVVLGTSVVDPDSSPELTGLGLNARPTPRRGRMLTLPIRLHPVNLARNHIEVVSDPEADREFLKELVDRGAPVTVQFASEVFAAYPSNYRFIPYRAEPDKPGWTGTFVLELDEVVS
jgi:hypothetical protein